MTSTPRDENYVPTLMAVSNADGVTPVVLYADPITHRLLVSASNGSLSGLSDTNITSVAQGDILYYDGSDWVNLAAGSNGQYLKTQGAGANPTWDTVSASVTSLDNVGDVTITTVASGEILKWNGSAWINNTLSEAGIQSQGDVLDDLNSLGVAASDGQFIVATGAGAFAYESGATVRTSLGLGSAAVVDTDLSDLNEATIEASIDTLANLTSIQGLTVTLADAGANAIFGWDDTAGAYENLTQGEVLAVIGDAAADASTKGVATFNASDFDASSGNISIDYTNGQKASTTQAGFLTEIATAAETTTGTDATRAVSPDGLAGSDYGKRNVQAYVVEAGTDVATGDGAAYFVIPENMGGMNLVGVHAEVLTAGTTGTTDIQIHNVTQAADMLSTKITIDSAETGSDTAATAAVIDSANDDVADYDVIRVDVDAVSTTAPQGLIVTLIFQLP